MARRRESVFDRLLVLPWWVARKFDRQRRRDDVRSLSSRQIVALVREGFRRRGYSAIESARASADAGIDLVLYKDGENFFVRCRQWRSSNVGVKPLRDLLNVITARDAAGGFFVTSGAYTDDARAFAKATSIDLIDGPSLEQIVLDVRRPEPFLDPTEGRRRTATHELAVDPSCPKCNGAMVRRTAAGRDFWGCLQSPICGGMIEIRDSRFETRDWSEM